MPIERVSNQGEISLKDFYAELLWSGEKFGDADDFNLRLGKNMIDFIDMINEIFKETQLWGLTSLTKLIIQKENDWESNCYITITGNGDGGYQIEYLIPEDKRPWKNARIHGVAEDLQRAKNFLIFAMNECEGWKDSQELKELVKKLDKE